MNTVSLTELRQKSKLPAKQAGGSTVSQFFDANKSSIAAVLPNHVSADRMLKIALGALRTTPALMDCTVESLFGAVVQCATLGLEPNTPMGHSYLIPFRNQKANRMDVQVIVGYRGLIDLARRSGQIISLSAHAVRAKDTFEFEYGLNEKLRHIPAQGDRGEIIAFYAVAKLVGGGHQFEVMTRADVDRIRDRTQSRGQYGPWKDHYEEMGRKTAVRRLFKYLPVSIELATAVAMDGLAEAGKDQNLDTALTGEWTIVQEQDSGHEMEPEQEMADTELPELVKATSPTTWPRKVVDAETGEVGWSDSTGAFFSPDLHGWNTAAQMPSVTESGAFRAKRGSRPATPTKAPKPAAASNESDDWSVE